MSNFEKIERGFTRLAAGLALIGGLGLVFATITTCLSIVLRLLRRMLDATLGGALDPQIWA